MRAEAAGPPPAIDPTAFVAPEARLGAGVVVGPFCQVGPGAVLEDGVRLLSHVVIDGITRLGAGTVVHPFTVLGGPPQHLRDEGRDTRLTVGPGSVIREQVTVNRGTNSGRGETVLGARVMVMAAVHVGHDCVIGDEVILASNCTLGGHVTVGAQAFIGGLAAIHQNCRIGTQAFVGGASGVATDVVPYAMTQGNPARLGGLNVVGLKRVGMPQAVIHTLRAAFHELFIAEEPPFRDRLDMVAQSFSDSPEVMAIVAFAQSGSRRPLMRAR